MHLQIVFAANTCAHHVRRDIRWQVTHDHLPPGRPPGLPVVRCARACQSCGACRAPHARALGRRVIACPCTARSVPTTACHCLRRNPCAARLRSGRGERSRRATACYNCNAWLRIRFGRRRLDRDVIAQRRSSLGTRGRRKWRFDWRLLARRKPGCIGRVWHAWHPCRDG